MKRIENKKNNREGWGVKHPKPFNGYATECYAQNLKLHIYYISTNIKYIYLF